ncbi:MAG: glycosyl hydrolase family 28 protein [Bacteroidota bacterium]
MKTYALNWKCFFNLSLFLPLLIGFGCESDTNTVEENSIIFYGAIGDGSTNNTNSIQAAIDKVSKAGGGRVIIPSGVFVSGTLFLKDGVELHLTEGAVLKGSPYLNDYPIIELETIRSYTERYTKKAFIYAESIQNIAITGKGKIDGNSSSKEFKEVEDISVKPLGIKLVSCENIRIEDVTIENAGLWLQHYLNCTDLNISGIKAFNHGNFTNDGLDIDGCRNVVIENAYIDSHDDALVFKSTGPAKCENIKVRNCTLRSHCHSLKFGTETTGGFKNIDIANIIIKPSEKLHPKTKQMWPVNSGMALEVTDGGTMENIHISNVQADSVYGPIFIKLGNRARKYKDDAAAPAPGKIKDIYLSNIEITNALNFSSSVTGFPGNEIENINLKNISIHYKEAPTPDEVFMTEVPENESLYPEITMFTKKEDKRYYLPAHGLFARHVNGLNIKNFTIQTTAGESREKYQFINVKDLELNEKLSDTKSGL